MPPKPPHPEFGPLCRCLGCDFPRWIWGGEFCPRHALPARREDTREWTPVNDYEPEISVETLEALPLWYTVYMSGDEE